MPKTSPSRRWIAGLLLGLTLGGCADGAASPASSSSDAPGTVEEGASSPAPAVPDGPVAFTACPDADELGGIIGREVTVERERPPDQLVDCVLTTGTEQLLVYGHQERSLDEQRAIAENAGSVVTDTPQFGPGSFRQQASGALAMCVQWFPAAEVTVTSAGSIDADTACEWVDVLMAVTPH